MEIQLANKFLRQSDQEPNLHGSEPTDQSTHDFRLSIRGLPGLFEDNVSFAALCNLNVQCLQHLLSSSQIGFERTVERPGIAFESLRFNADNSTAKPANRV